jgi:hypothetical protein
MVTADGSKSKQINSSAEKDESPVERRRQQEQKMGEEKVEAKAEEATPTTAASVAFDPSI